MKAIYTRTIGVYDDKLNEAMEISKGLAEVRNWKLYSKIISNG